MRWKARTRPFFPAITYIKFHQGWKVFLCCFEDGINRFATTGFLRSKLTISIMENCWRSFWHCHSLLQYWLQRIDTQVIEFGCYNWQLTSKYFYHHTYALPSTTTGGLKKVSKKKKKKQQFASNFFLYSLCFFFLQSLTLEWNKVTQHSLWKRRIRLYTTWAAANLTGLKLRQHSIQRWRKQNIFLFSDFGLKSLIIQEYFCALNFQVSFHKKKYTTKRKMDL